jgi:hypothetical protein
LPVDGKEKWMSKEKKMIDGYVTASGRNNWQNGSDIN